MSATPEPRAAWSTSLRRDTLAAFAVLGLLVPQGVAYAMLAGVPPATGLACAAAAALAYAPFGSSRYLAVGPVALTCLLVAGGLQPLAEAGSDRYLDLAVALSLMVAVIFALLGLVRAGFIANFLGQPAIVGFNAGGALLTAASQVRPFFGLPASAAIGTSAENPWPVLLHLGSTSALALGVGVATLVVIVALPRWNRRVPAPLVACTMRRSPRCGGDSGTTAWSDGSPSSAASMASTCSVEIHAASTAPRYASSARRSTSVRMPVSAPTSGPLPARSAGSSTRTTPSGSVGSDCPGDATTTTVGHAAPTMRATRCSSVSSPSGSQALGRPIRRDSPPARITAARRVLTVVSLVPGSGPWPAVMRMQRGRRWNQAALRTWCYARAR